jgi:hypothetical protein
MNRRTLRVAAGAAFFFSIAVFPASAADQPNCGFGDRLAALEAIRQNSGADYFAGLRAELDLRKELLRDAAACGAQEALTLKTTLESTDVPPSIEPLRRQFAEQFDEALGRYEDAAGRIPNLGIAGSKELARSLRDWRRSNYEPLAGRALHFILWAKNQELLKTARERYAAAVRFIRLLNLQESGDIAGLIASIERNLGAAEAANAAARRSFEEQYPPRVSLGLTRDYLEALARVYENFLALSERLSAIIPQ